MFVYSRNLGKAVRGDNPPATFTLITLRTGNMAIAGGSHMIGHIHLKDPREFDEVSGQFVETNDELLLTVAAHARAIPGETEGAGIMLHPSKPGEIIVFASDEGVAVQSVYGFGYRATRDLENAPRTPIEGAWPALVRHARKLS